MLCLPVGRSGSMLGGRRGSRANSLDLGPPPDLTSLETRLMEKTDLIDDMKKVLPMSVRAPGIVAIGMQGSGKSTVLETLSGVPLSRASGMRAVVKVKIVSDPTCVKEYILVSKSDPLLKYDTTRLENAADLPRHLVKLDNLLARGVAAGHLVGAANAEEANGKEEEEVMDAIAAEEEDNGDVEGEGRGGRRPTPPRRSDSLSGGGDAGVIYVLVVRPSGPTYCIMDFPGFASLPDAAHEARLRRVLAEDNDPDKLILAVLSIKDVSDRADIIHAAKRLDPNSKRTIGVVTKAHLVTKEMGIVEKLQMSSNKAVALPLGYVAVCAADPNNFAATRQEVMLFEAAFFSSNPLLKGLRPERWGVASLKSLVLNCQTNSITLRIPHLSQAIRAEIEDLSKDPQPQQHHPVVGEGGKKKKGHGHERAPVVFDRSEDVFSKLCSEMTSVMFEVNELASGSSTRQDRKLNLGPRYLLAVESREAEARRALPVCTSVEVGEWLNRELGEFRGVTVSPASSMMHPLFKKAIRELCFPVLRAYAKAVVQDMDGMLGHVAGALIVERFGPYTRLVEALMRDLNQVQATKKEEATVLVSRLLEAELHWIYVDEVDMECIAQETEKDLAATERGEKAGKKHEDVWGMEGPGAEGGGDGAGLGGTSKSGKAFLQSDQSREVHAMQCTLHYYVRLLLRRVFYAVPMNVRNILISEFRYDLVSMTAEKYNDAFKLRTLMAEELWAGQSRQQRALRKAALEEVMAKLDLLS